jgi:hypothetical protein
VMQAFHYAKWTVTLLKDALLKVVIGLNQAHGQN